MHDAEKDRKFISVIKQVGYGMGAALIGAWLFTSASFYSNGGTSLYADIMWALIGAVVGLIGGVLLARKGIKY